LQHFNNYPSQSLLEAMACGNAVVATNVGETHRLVDETVGLLIEPEAPALAEALNRLLDSPDLPRMQQAARANGPLPSIRRSAFLNISTMFTAGW
jgi:glycosyltransferase involved in cell wall biosynthesis